MELKQDAGYIKIDFSDGYFSELRSFSAAFKSDEDPDSERKPSERSLPSSKTLQKNIHQVQLMYTVSLAWMYVRI